MGFKGAVWGHRQDPYSITGIESPALTKKSLALRALYHAIPDSEGI